MKERRACWGLLQRRACLVPTWRGWLMLLLALVGALLVGARTIHPFLAVTAPVTGGALVVEGWLPDYALRAVVTEAGRNSYTGVYVVGGPLDRGAPLSEYASYAELGAATLARLGLPTNTLHAAPAPPVAADRTYAAAVALRRWFEEHGGVPAKLNVVSVGPHARRSRLLFRCAFGRQTQVGVVSVPNPDYDPQRWWAYSIGFRTVVGESVGYLYVKLVFRRSEGTVLDAQESAAGAALSFAPRRGENAEPFAWRLAYDLAHRFKRLCLPPRYGHATLGTLRTDLLVVPARLVRRGGRQRAAPAARLSPPRILRGGVSQGRGPAPVAGNMILSGRDRQNARISMGSASCQTILTLS